MNLSELDAIIAEHAGRKGALLPMLHAVQRAFGCIDAKAEARIAQALNLSRAEVLSRFQAGPRSAPGG
jgi:formate dehydrogenase subunit gamma